MVNWFWLVVVLVANPVWSQVTFSGPPVNIDNEREPYFIVGADNASLKMMYVWSPNCVDSGIMYRNTIIPLIHNEVVQGKAQIAFFISPRDQEDLEAHALLLQCVPVEGFRSASEQWLAMYGKISESTKISFNKHQVPSELAWIATLNGAPSNLESCIKEEKKTRLLATRYELEKRISETEYPFLMVKGKTFYMSDTLVDIREHIKNN
jgi:hypothetical protein